MGHGACMHVMCVSHVNGQAIHSRGKNRYLFLLASNKHHSRFGHVCSDL